MDEIVQKPLSWLRQHPQNKAVFDSRPKEFQGIRTSIEEHGIQEPIIAKEDGTILSGHLRYFSVVQLATTKAKAEGSEPDFTKVMAPVRIHPAFKSEYDEFCYLVEANLQRRQLTPEEVAMAYKILREARTKEDRRKLPKEEKGGSKGRRVSAREQSAGSLNISVRSGDAHELIFTTEGMPEEVKELARNKEVSIVRAGEVAKAHLVDGKIQDPDKLVEEVKALAVRPVKQLPTKPEVPTITLVPTPAVKSSSMHEQIADVENVLEVIFSEGVMVDEEATRRGLLSVLSRVRAFLSGMGWVGPEQMRLPDQLPPPQPTRFFCADCGEPQFTCPSGTLCANGHGGADSLDAPPTPPTQQQNEEIDVEAMLQDSEEKPAPALPDDDFSDLLKSL